MENIHSGPGDLRFDFSLDLDSILSPKAAAELLDEINNASLDTTPKAVSAQNMSSPCTRVESADHLQQIDATHAKDTTTLNPTELMKKVEDEQSSILEKLKIKQVEFEGFIQTSNQVRQLIPQKKLGPTPCPTTAPKRQRTEEYWIAQNQSLTAQNSALLSNLQTLQQENNQLKNEKIKLQKEILTLLSQ